MNLTITIVLLLTLCFIIWITSSSKRKKMIEDDFLVYNYHTKPNYLNKRLVLIIETFTDLGNLLTLLRNILKQNIKVDSIILISKNEDLNKVKLINNTCTLNKTGGLSFLLKESGNNTIIIFIFPEGFNAFSNPCFLKQFIKMDKKINGILKVNTSSVNVEIGKIYSSS